MVQHPKVIALHLALFTAVLLLCTTQAHAGSTAFSVPISDKLVHGELLLPNGEKAEFFIREGAMLKFKDTEYGYYYGLTPVVEDDEVTFTLFELKEVGDGDEMVFQLSQGQAWVEAESTSLSLPHDFEFRVLEVLDHSFPADQQVPYLNQLSMRRLQDAMENSGTCCVSCGSTRVCGCMVSLSCGSCCSDSCCGGGSSDGDLDPINQVPLGTPLTDEEVLEYYHGH